MYILYITFSPTARLLPCRHVSEAADNLSQLIYYIILSNALRVVRVTMCVRIIILYIIPVLDTYLITRYHSGFPNRNIQY